LDWNKYRLAKNNYRNAIRKSKKQYFISKFEESTASSHSWAVMNELTGYRKRKLESITSLDVDGKRITTEADVCANLVEDFIVINEGAHNISASTLDEMVNLYEENYVENYRDLTVGVTPDEVQRAISVVNGARNSELHIPSRIIKQFKVQLAIPLALYFTTLFSVCKFPSGFKASTIIPQYKGKGSRSKACNFRPIVNLPFIGKIFEKIIYFKIYDSVERDLNENQHGFRTNRSCETAVAQYSQAVFDYLDHRNGRVVAVFIDLKKAFNSVRHDIIIMKLLRDFNLSPTLVKLLRNYLKNRVSNVMLSNYISSTMEYPRGLDKGPP